MTPDPPFLITIDTEGDNLWSHPREITTRNWSFLQRFQDLCESFGLIPTYLTNFEMAQCSGFVELGRRLLRRGTAEIGMHLHAWNSPPIMPLTDDDFGRAPYLTEYPLDVIEEKVAYMTRLLRDTFEAPITSHRAGRYGFNGAYARILEEYGYLVDCSVTPGVSWRLDPGGLGGGPDYTIAPHRPYFLDFSDVCQPGNSGLLEVPVTIQPAGTYVQILGAMFEPRSLLGRIWNRLAPPVTWLYPNGCNGARMRMVVSDAVERGDACLEFTLHSSNLMPGGSPVFRTAEAVEALYRDLRALFSAAAVHFRGAGLSDFATEYRQTHMGPVCVS